jgi:hypothetical protein
LAGKNWRPENGRFCLADKRLKNLSFQFAGQISSGMQFFHCFLITKARKYINQGPLIPNFLNYI